MPRCDSYMFDLVHVRSVLIMLNKLLVLAESLILANDLRDEGFTVVSAHPGFANTSMGRNVKKATEGVRDPVRSSQETVADMMKIITSLTPDDNGKYLLYDGTEMPW